MYASFQGKCASVTIDRRICSCADECVKAQKSVGCTAMSYALLIIYTFPLNCARIDCVFASLMQSVCTAVTTQTQFLADTHTTGSPLVYEWVWITLFPHCYCVENILIPYTMA